MRNLFVYADFDWFQTPELIGELTFDIIRGNEVYGFNFDKQWLSNHGDIFLGNDLHYFPGLQYSDSGKDIFSCFSDALPDRWGRTLLKRREQIIAQEEKRPVKRLTSFDYLAGIDDNSRMGAFRFAETKGGLFINSETSMRIPPLTEVRELMYAANEIEKSEEKHLLPSRKWISQLILPGSSLGGARPKASVIDESGVLTIAKFPSRNDDYNVAQWEHLMHILGRKAGLNVANTRIIKGDKHEILLSKRFDRTPDNRRVHFASAMTMLGLADGDDASSGFGYPDIVDFIIRHGSQVMLDLEQLFRRVAFYIIIGNSDDHFRNHGFLLTSKGWELSPAYDINPTLSSYQSLMINSKTNEADLKQLLSSADEYMLSNQRAKEIVNEVRKGMENWELNALHLGINKRDISIFAPRINRWLDSDI